MKQAKQILNQLYTKQTFIQLSLRQSRRFSLMLWLTPLFCSFLYTHCGANSSITDQYKTTGNLITDNLLVAVGNLITPNSEIEISDCTGLNNIRNNLSGKYKLVANIDASCLTSPISSSSATAFTGSFDGGGHTISNLTINLPHLSCVGLFGYTGSDAKIKNVGLLGVSISGRDYVGGLVGYDNGGSITNSYVTGTVSGRNRVASLIGYTNGGSITNSYAAGAVTAAAYAGSLIGYNNRGSITNSYATGTVTGTSSSIGGLIGYNNSGSITNSYATGAVSGTSFVGGLVGYNNSGNISGIHYFVDSDGGADGIGSGSCSGTCTQKSLDELGQISSVSGWTSANWSFGAASQLPALKYGDDPSTTEIECGGDNDVICGQLLSGQRYCSTTIPAATGGIIQACDIQAYGKFGVSVAIDGDTAIVGAPSEGTGGTDAGAAYIFKRSGLSWIEQAKILASDKQAGDLFGVSVAIDGDKIIVGAPNEDTGGTDAGAAYIFKRTGSTWLQYAKINLSGENSLSGTSVAIDGDTYVIGAPGIESVSLLKITGLIRSPGGEGIYADGSVYISSLTASDKQAGDLFGTSVAIDGDKVIVGAPNEDTNGTDAGAAYIFKRTGTTWPQYAKINFAGENSLLGTSVAIDDDSYAIGAPGTESVYSLKLVGLRPSPGGVGIDADSLSISTFTAFDNQADDNFGAPVVLDDDTLIVGALLEDSGGTDTGAAYVFKDMGTNWPSWSPYAKVQPSDNQANDNFGKSIAVDGDALIIGSPLEDTGETNAGAAYMFSLSDFACPAGQFWKDSACVFLIFNLTSNELSNYSTDGIYRLSWRALPGVDAYEWQERSLQNKNWGTSTFVRDNQSMLIDKTSSDIYEYRVRACSDSSDSLTCGEWALVSVRVCLASDTTSIFTPRSCPQTDPLYSEQWHLQNPGGFDLNLKGVHKTGNGVVANVINAGMEIGHEDLAANVLAGRSRDFVGKDNDPSPTSQYSGAGHGTNVGGIIASVAHNHKGGRGVAPEASLIAHNWLRSQSNTNLTISLTAAADIANMSYGQNNFDDRRPSNIAADAIRQGTSSGRANKGTVYIKAAGNGFNRRSSGDNAFGNCSAPPTVSNVRLGCDNSNMDPNNTLPEVIVVGAVSSNGIKSSYSTVGSANLISAPSDLIVTTDPSSCSIGYSRSGDCKYNRRFNGTSAATPMVSGVVALMLEANPSLSWRDVRHILIQTAHKVDASRNAVRTISGNSSIVENALVELGWTRNAAGYEFHNWYGFGAVDAKAAVDLASTYTSYRSSRFGRTCNVASGSYASSSGKGSSAAVIPDKSVSGMTASLSISSSSCQTQVEAVQVDLQVTHPRTSDLGIFLVSPSGTTSLLLQPFNRFADTNDLNMVLTSQAFYGENTSGNWTIKVIDYRTGNVGTLDSWTLKVYGR